MNNSLWAVVAPSLTPDGYDAAASTYSQYQVVAPSLTPDGYDGSR